MKTIITLIIILLANTSYAYNSCGFKPFRPLGCFDAEAVCVCSGNSCEWVWICK